MLGSDWAQKLLDGTRSAGVVGLGYVQGPLRQPLGITRALTSASSFQGAKFGIRPSKVSEMTLKALGATPVGWSALTGLDGIEMDVPSIAGNKYDLQATSLTGNVVLWPRPSMFFANAAWFDGLTAAQQQALRSAAAAVDQKTVTRVKSDASTATDTLCRRSVKVTDASSQAIDGLRAKVQPVIDELETGSGNEGDDRRDREPARLHGDRGLRSLRADRRKRRSPGRTHRARRHVDDQLHEGRALGGTAHGQRRDQRRELGRLHDDVREWPRQLCAEELGGEAPVRRGRSR